MAFDDNLALAKIFEEMASFLELQGENFFKVKAYQRAARQLESLERPLAELQRTGELSGLPGFGKALLEKVTVYLEEGRVPQHQALKEQFPPTILDLLDVPGLGAKKVAMLYRELGVGSLEDLKRAIEENRVRDLKGFGLKSQEKFAEGLAYLRQGEQRWPLGKASRLAALLLERLRKLPGVEAAEAAGSLRRGRETVGDLDLLVAGSQAEAVMDAFVSWVEPSEVLMKGPTRSSIRWDGLQVDLRCVEELSFGAALQYFTGSKDHNVALRGRAERLGLKLNEYGLFDCLGVNRASQTEEAIYQALGLPWIAPELRESGREMEEAEAGRLPELVQLSQIRGNLHTHSLWSDGQDSLEALGRRAIEAGYEYLAVTDHSRSMVIANGLTVERLLEQGQEIQRLNQLWEGHFRLLWGTEVDILSDGTLDFPDEVLARLDFVVASIHSQFQLSAEAMTERLVKALCHPHVDALGHPSGRLLHKRAGYEADWDRVFRVAQEQGVALEMNCSMHRLDLDDRRARRALELGCTLTLNTDAHSLDEFSAMEWGIRQARRAGMPASRLLNTLPLEELRSRSFRVARC